MFLKEVLILFDLDSCVGFITNKEAKKLAEAFNSRLIPLGTTRVQWITMYYLYKYGSLTQNELSEKLDSKPSTVARLIDRMEKEGLVERVKDSKDRRIFNIVLSEKGKDLWKDLMPEGEKMSNIFSSNISEKDMETFKKVLKQMVDNIN